MKPREVHLRIGRLVVDAEAGTDRAALARALAEQLPTAIGERLLASPAPGVAPATLHVRIADAVAPRVAAQIGGPGGRQP